MGLGRGQSNGQRLLAVPPGAGHPASPAVAGRRVPIGGTTPKQTDSQSDFTKQ